IANGLTEDGTQSETSIAINKAGTVLIAGYNDSKGFPNPMAADQVTLSVSGIARSGDGGTTWAPLLLGSPPNDTGFGVLPTVPNGSVYGDPDVKYDALNDRF